MAQVAGFLPLMWEHMGDGFLCRLPSSPGVASIWGSELVSKQRNKILNSSTKFFTDPTVTQPIFLGTASLVSECSKTSIQHLPAIGKLQSQGPQTAAALWNSDS